jgi:hypothetical protein
MRQIINTPVGELRHRLIRYLGGATFTLKPKKRSFNHIPVILLHSQ